MRTINNYIYFFTGILGNWYKSKIIYNNNIFFSSEQLFMYLKAIFFKDDETALKILNCKNSKTAKDLGREVKNFNNKLWEFEREMLCILLV
jgi:ribA/ribD-fused uncharacterized protein